MKSPTEGFIQAKKMKTYKEKFNDLQRENQQLRELTDIELERLKKTLLEITLDVAAVCKKYSITYMLGGGSCLGAIRHNGFIPWDDDVDIMMPREDYEMFKQVFSQELGKKYILDAPNSGNVATNRFPKVLKKGTRYTEVDNTDDERACIKIDIFVLENVPKNIVLRYLKGFWCTVLMFIGGRVLEYENEKKHPGVAIHRIGILFSFVKSAKWFDLVDKAVQHNRKTGILGAPTGRKHYFGEIFSSDVFLPCKETLFENVRLQIPANADAYLKNLYGDYMTLPPIEKREKHYITDIDFGE